MHGTVHDSCRCSFVEIGLGKSYIRNSVYYLTPEEMLEEVE